MSPVLTRWRSTRVLGGLSVVLLVAGTATAVDRLGNSESDLAVSTKGAPRAAVLPPMELDTSSSSTSTTASTLAGSTSSTTAAPVRTLPVPKVTTSTSRRPRPAAPADPSTPTTLAPVVPLPVSSPCPGAAPVINAYGVYVADRTGVVRRVGDVTGADVTVNQMSWSPDGTMLAFSTWQGTIGGTGTISVVGRDGLGARVLTKGGEVGTAFAWTVDGRQVVFATRDPNTTPNRSALLAADVHSGAVRTLISGSDVMAPIAALPDGQRILFWGVGGLAVVSLDGSGVRKVADASSIGSLSPDGRLYAFVENAKLNVVEVDTGRFVVGGPYSGGGSRPGGPVRWSPDGRLLAYPADEAPPTLTLVVARPDGSVVRRIADLRGDYQFSPVGDRIAVVTGADLRSDVYNVPGPGNRAGLVSAMRLAWAPGASLAGIEYFLDHPEDSPDGTGAVCLSAADGGTPRRLVTFSGRTIGNGLHWSPGGEVLAFQVTR
ncbi:MAG: hypothetical protein LC750_09065 [Actinobacteria bacterium]|nr:hypothetical protein [Actinomycetota bacterium]